MTAAQFKQHKEANHGRMLLFQSGDWLEAYSEDIAKISEVVGREIPVINGNLVRMRYAIPARYLEHLSSLLAQADIEHAVITCN